MCALSKIWWITKMALPRLISTASSRLSHELLKLTVNYMLPKVESWSVWIPHERSIDYEHSSYRKLWKYIIRYNNHNMDFADRLKNSNNSVFAMLPMWQFWRYEEISFDFKRVRKEFCNSSRCYDYDMNSQSFDLMLHKLNFLLYSTSLSRSFHIFWILWSWLRHVRTKHAENRNTYLLNLPPLSMDVQWSHSKHKLNRGFSNSHCQTNPWQAQNKTSAVCCSFTAYAIRPPQAGQIHYWLVCQIQQSVDT